jgi:hypothetical protein
VARGDELVNRFATREDYRILTHDAEGKMEISDGLRDLSMSFDWPRRFDVNS